MYVYYDKVYEFDFYRMKALGLGASMTNLDFSMSCEEFVGITNRSCVAIWSILDGSVTKVTTLLSNITPISEMQVVGSKVSNIVCYSRARNSILNIRNATNEKYGNKDMLTRQLTSLLPEMEQ